MNGETPNRKRAIFSHFPVVVLSGPDTTVDGKTLGLANAGLILDARTEAWGTGRWLAGFKEGFWQEFVLWILSLVPEARYAQLGKAASLRLPQQVRKYVPFDWGTPSFILQAQLYKVVSNLSLSEV